VLGACVGGGEWALGGPVPIPLMGFTGGMLVLIGLITYLGIVFWVFQGFFGRREYMKSCHWAALAPLGTLSSMGVRGLFRGATWFVTKLGRRIVVCCTATSPVRQQPYYQPLLNVS
jgi:hypothetical protein